MPVLKTGFQNLQLKQWLHSIQSLLLRRKQKFPLAWNLVFQLPETFGSHCPIFQRTVMSYLIVIFESSPHCQRKIIQRQILIICKAYSVLKLCQGRWRTNKIQVTHQTNVHVDQPTLNKLDPTSIKSPPLGLRMLLTSSFLQCRKRESTESPFAYAGSASN